MTQSSDPRRDPEAVLDDIERAFKEAGFEAHVLREPADPYTGVVGFVDQGEGRKRQLIVAFEKDRDDACRVCLSRRYLSPSEKMGSVEPDDAVQIDLVQKILGIGKDIVARSHQHLVLSRTMDEKATGSDIRSAMHFIADHVRNANTFHNATGSDHISLAHAVIRLLERIEELEHRDSSRSNP